MKLIIFLPRFPYPLNKGDKLRAFNQIKELSYQHDIYLFCLANHKVKQQYTDILREFCADIRVEKLTKTGILLSLIKSIFNPKIPLQVALFTTGRAKKHFAQYFRQIQPNAAYFQFVRSAEYAKRIRKFIPKTATARKTAPQTENTSPRLVLDFQDCLSMNIYRRSKVSNPLMKLIFSLEAKRLRNYENAMYDLFDATAIITRQDRDCIITQRRRETKIVENGLDRKYFEYDKKFKKQYDIIFSGNMSYKPNVTAAKFLINEVMPLVWKKNKDVTVVLAGSNPAREVRKLASDKVTVTGWVDDMREYYAKSMIFAAPMQIGTGLQNKLLEAMAMGLPCVTTPLANHALKSEPDKHLLVAQSAKETADCILMLIKNPSLRFNIAKEGNKFVKENYNWQTSTARLNKLFIS